MTLMRSSVLASVAVAGLMLASSSAIAGGPKAQRLLRVELKHGGLVSAAIGDSTSTFPVTLAQVVSPALFATGRPCVTQPTDYSIAEAATRMGLTTSAQVIPEVHGRTSAVYLTVGESGAFQPSKSLNETIVLAGLATVSHLKGSYRVKFLAAQRAARRAHHGLWSRCRQP
jgi:Staphylococcal nuclease homologue